MAAVAAPVHYLCDARHIRRNSLVAADRVVWIRSLRQIVAHLDVHWQPPGLQRTARRRARFEGIMAIQLDAGGNQVIDVWRDDLRRRCIVADTVVAHRRLIYDEQAN